MKTKQFLKSLSSLQRCAAVLLLLLIPFAHAWTTDYSSTPLVSLDFSSSLPSVTGVTYHSASYSSGKISWGGNYSYNSRDVQITFTNTGSKVKIVLGHVTSGSSMTFKYRLDNGSDTNWTLNKSATSDVLELSASAGSHTIALGPGGSSTRTVVTSIAIYDEASSCTTNATVTEGSNSSVTTTTATVSCSSGISSLGSAGCSISSYGFVLGTSANPTISNTKYQVGTTYTTTGNSFSKNLTGLTAGTTYYVRPYATNGNGTAYGTQTSFTTLPTEPTFSPTSGSTVGGSQTITITGHSGSTVYYAWATSAPTADAIYNSGSGEHGTASAGTATTTVVSGKTLYAISRLTNNSAVASATYTVDITAPTLSSSSPADGATDVTPSGNIVLTFSENVTIVDASKFSLTGGTLSTGSATVSGAVVTIPYSGLVGDNDYTFSISAGAVRDAVGNLNAATSFDFTAGETCSAPSAPIITSSESQTAFTYGESISLSADCSTGEKASTTYAWYKGDSWAAAYSAGAIKSAEIAGNYGDIYQKTAALSDAGTYWCEASNGTGCEAHNATGFTITVSKADITATAGTGSASSITANGATLPFTLTNTTNVASVTIKIYNNSTDALVKTVSGITAATSGSEAVTGLSASTTYYYTVTPIGDSNHNDGSESAKSSTFTTLVQTYTLSYSDGSATSGSKSGGTAAGSYVEGATITVPAQGTLDKSGYTFCGWSDGTTMYVAGQTFSMPASNVTLTAIWDGTGSSITLTHFGKQYYTSGPRRGYAYVGSTSGTKYIIESDDSNHKNIDSDSSAIQLVYNNKYIKVLGPNATTTLSDSLFSGVTEISFKWKYCASTTTYTTGIDIYVGSTKVGTKSLTGNKNDAYATATLSNIASKNGAVKFVNTGTSSSNQKFYIDDITITCGTPSSAKTVTFNKGSGPSTVTGLPAAVKVPSGSKIARPATDPSATNYIFSGWVTTSGGSSPFNFASTTISSNTTIYASWEAKTAPTQYTFSLSEPCASASPSATLSGSQSGWSYQLYKDGVASGDPKAGTGNALTWTSLGAGTYLVKTVETSTQASAQIGSSATVYAGTSITTNLASSRNVNANVATSVSITATGTGLSYQWYTCNSDGSGKVAIEGKTTNSLSSYTFTNDDAPTKYICCVVTGTCGTLTSTIQTVNITKTYLLTYNANGGGGAPAAAYRAATTASLSGTTPTWSNHRFLGWNTESDGSGTRYAASASFPMPAQATTLWAEWQEEASLQWVPNLNTAESSIGTNSKSSSYTTRIPTSAMSAIGNYGSLTITSSKKTDLTSRIETPTTYNAGKYMYVTFDVPDDYEFVPTSISVKVQAVGNGEHKYAILDISDTRNSLRSTATKCDGTSDGSTATVTLEGDKTALTGTVTLKIYVYNFSGESTSNNCYRLGSPITISGDINYICPDRPTIVKPASAKAMNVYADESKTLSVEVETYNSGALTYQWKKDGANIAGANSATYTVVGSTLTVGTTYAYTCDVTEEGACATVTSPAYNVTGASPDCGSNYIAKVDLTSATAADKTNATATVNLGAKDSGDPAGCYKLLGKGKYLLFGLANGYSFRENDTIVFRIYTKQTYIYIYNTDYSTDLTTGDAVWSKTGLTTGQTVEIEIPLTSALATSFNANNKVLIMRNDNVGQNHCIFWVRVKRYTCPDVVMFDANTDSNWGTTSNWVGATGRGAGLPTSDVRALITKPVTVDVTNAVAGEVVIDQHSSNTGKLIIPSTGVLNVEGPITKTTNGTSLSATDVADVIIDCSETSQGALIFEQPASGELQTQGTVNFYTKSSRVGGKLQWQYVGYPFISGYDYDYGGYYINKYSETQGGWIVMRDQGDRTINAWDGLAISGDGAGGASMTGTFVPTTGDKEFTLTYTAGKGKGKNLIGNSWTAPIQILEMEEEDFGGARAAIYVFNTGRYGSKEVSPSGSWVTLAIDAVKDGVAAGTWTNLTVIPAFQGFQVKTAAAANKTLTLNYDKHVRPATDADAMNEPLRAPARRANSEINHMRLTVESDVAHQEVFLFEGPEFSEDFDNGWDGDYVGVSGQHAYLYVVSPTLGKMAIDAESSLEGRIVALQSAAEKEYTFTFAGNGMGYYLNDLKTQTSTLIEAGNSYTFTYEQGDDYNRFMISATPFAKTTPTGNEDADWNGNGVQKVIYKDHMYIIRGGRVFDATGAMVK